MRKLEFNRDGKKLVITLWDNDRKVANQRFDPLSDRQQKTVASLVGITVEQLLAYVDDFASRQAGFVIELHEEPVAPNIIHVRPINEPSSNAVPYLDIKSALHAAGVEDVLEWESKDWMCGLDIDYHGTTPPPRDWLLGMVEVHLQPRPFLWHYSKGGGLHLFYRQNDKLTAEELAAIAGLRFKQLDSTCTVELKRVLRGTSEMLYELSDINSDISVAEWVEYEGVESKEIALWLESEGMELNQRYDHLRCPITPNTQSHGEPVQVGEQGIYCHRCAGLGASLGSRRAGWAPWSSLIGVKSAGVVGGMIRNLTHWGHAKWIVGERFGVDESFAKLAYRAACKIYHPDDPRVNRLFSSETDAFARVKGRWTSVESNYEWPKDCVGILASLPVCEYADDEGKIKPLPARINMFQQPTIDLSKWGYPDLEVIRGCKLYSHHLEYRQPNRIVIEVPLKREANYGKSFLPRYLPAGQRMDESAARAVYEQSLPGINWNYIYLLIAAKGCWEGRAGMPPTILVDGVTGAAKTGMLKLASGILGDFCTDIIQTDDTVNLRELIRQGANNGTFVAVNEFIKDASRGRNRMTPVQALDPILNLTPQSTSKAMYVGPVMMGQPPVLVFTEQDIPRSLRAQSQIARRCHHVRLEEPLLHWTSCLVRDGVALDEYRCLTQQHADAANAILSCVVDKYFSLPMSFSDIAKDLGVTTLLDSPHFNDPASLLLDFFIEVCRAPDLDGPEKKRFQGPGWKIIRKSDDTELNSLWNELADPEWFTSRQIKEKSWKEILGTSDPVRVDINDNKQAVVVRFAQGSLKQPVAVNQEIPVNQEIRARLA